MLVKVFIIVLILIGLALVALSIGILLKKGGRFPEIHIGRNQRLKDKGIHCANTTDALERENYKPIDNKTEE